MRSFGFDTLPPQCASPVIISNATSAPPIAGKSAPPSVRPDIAQHGPRMARFLGDLEVVTEPEYCNSDLVEVEIETQVTEPGLVWAAIGTTTPPRIHQVYQRLMVVFSLDEMAETPRPARSGCTCCSARRLRRGRGGRGHAKEAPVAPGGCRQTRPCKPPQPGQNQQPERRGEFSSRYRRG